MAKLEKGQHGPLHVTQKAERRIFAGLGWEPHAESGLMETLGAIMGQRKTWHDLDLSCYTFDAAGKLLDEISSTPDHHSDGSGKIYHSGDNREGIGDGDDEQISVELLKLDPRIDLILFVVSIKSGHTFGEIDSPEIRLADGYSGHNFLHTALSAEEGRGKPAFAFASIYRTADGWNVHNISKFLDTADIAKLNGSLGGLLARG